MSQVPHINRDHDDRLEKTEKTDGGWAAVKVVESGQMVSVSKAVRVPGCLCPLLQEYRIPRSKNGAEGKANINITLVLRRMDIFQRKFMFLKNKNNEEQREV